MADRIEDRARFDLVRYANCWEDAEILCEALAPRPGARILSIASAGDNVFALLADGAEVVAADLSGAQLACVELRKAAFLGLDHAGVLGFLGFRPEKARAAIFERLKGGLSAEARSFWEARPGEVAGGFAHAGKFESYFRAFRRGIVPFIHGRRAVEELLAEKDAAARLAFYEKTWDSRRWRFTFRLFFSRFVMGLLGRDPEFFRYVEGSVADRILSRVRYALTVLPTHANPFLEYILTGNFGRSLPRYLHPSRFEAVRRGLERLVLFRGPVEEAARAHRGAGFDGFNLSDIFEYLDDPTTESVYAALLGTARPGARFVYWNMLVPRSCPASLAGRVKPLEVFAKRLFDRDLAFFYSAFRVEEVAG